MSIEVKKCQKLDKYHNYRDNYSRWVFAAPTLLESGSYEYRSGIIAGVHNGSARFYKVMYVE